MAEKILNTRIQLKYDTWSVWNNDTLGDNKGAKLVLKKGEIGICQIPAETNAGQSASEPVVLFKVGDGSTPFKSLAWASAKAADVYGWAKQASLPIERDAAETGTAGNVISTIKFESGKIIYTTATVATSEGLAQLTTRVGNIENTMATDTELQAAVETINNTIATLARKQELTDGLATKADKTAYEATAADVATIKDDYLKAADKTELTNSITGVDNRFANYTPTEGLDGKITELGYAKTTAIPTKVSELENDVPYLVAADVAGKADKTYVDEELAKKANQTDFEAVKTTVDNFFADDAAINDTIDTLKEIADYIANDKEGAADITARVGALEGKVDVEKVSTAIATAKSEAATDAQTKANTAEANAKAHAETKVNELANGQVKTNTDAIAAINNAETGILAQAKTESANQAAAVLAEAQTYADQAEADALAAAKADAANLYETKGTAQGIVDGLDLANTYQPKGEYASKAQGEAADTAVQTISAPVGADGAPNGLKAVKTDTDVAISFDDSVVFVFNCGDAQTVI